LFEATISQLYRLHRRRAEPDTEESEGSQGARCDEAQCIERGDGIQAMERATPRGDAAGSAMDVEGAASGRLRGGRMRGATQSVDNAKATAVAGAPTSCNGPMRIWRSSCNLHVRRQFGAEGNLGWLLSKQQHWILTFRGAR
jgi:hypothetical protein